MSDEDSSQDSSQGKETEEVKPCPVPEEHIKVFSGCCDKFQKGEMSELDVMIEVAQTLKKIGKKPDVEPTDST